MSLFDKDIIEKDLGYLPNPRENVKFQIQRIATRINESLKATRCMAAYFNTMRRAEDVKYVLGELLEALFYCNDRRMKELGFLGNYELIKNFEVYTHDDFNTNTYIIVKYTFHDKITPEMVIVSVD